METTSALSFPYLYKTDAINPRLFTGRRAPGSWGTFPGLSAGMSTQLSPQEVMEIVEMGSFSLCLSNNVLANLAFSAFTQKWLSS